VLLATYPEVFTGGGIIAGMPYKAALGMKEAFMAMLRGRTRSPVEWGDLVRAATDHKGPWPRVSVWQGDADRTVAPANAVEVVNQWANVHGVTGPAEEDEVNGHRRITMRDADGTAVVEFYSIAGMAHGTPIHPGDAEDQIGTEAPYLLSAGIASSYHIARFWGLAPEVPVEELEKIVEAGAATAEIAPAPPEPVAEVIRPPEPEPKPEPEPVPEKPGLAKRLWKALKGIVSGRVTDANRDRP
jgi:feruloyl esterase